MKRICLFAGYDKQNIIDDYVVYYIRELSKFADIFYFADNDMSKSELAKLNGITKFASAKKHGRYDFGSWAEIINHIGYDVIEQYDNVLLANDSCFAPCFDLAEMFVAMEAKRLDAWGICGNKFMMSFFINLDKNIVQHPEFRQLFDNIKSEKDKNIVIKKYERGLNNFIVENGFKWSVYISDKDVKIFYKKNGKMIREALKIIPWWARIFVKLAPNKVRLYEDGFILPFLMKMPLIKKMSFMVSENIMPSIALEIMKQHSSYDFAMIEKYFARIGFEFKRPLGQILRENFCKKIKNFIWDKKYRGNKFIIRVFTIPVYVKKLNLK